VAGGGDPREVGLREARLRGWSYYRALDPELTLERFAARPLAVPAPAIGDEGLGPEGFRERYGVNPFVDASLDRHSTFSMDVDTASFHRALHLLRAGSLPPPGEVRVEEFVNSFPGDELAERGAVFSVFSEGGPSPFGGAGAAASAAAEGTALRAGAAAADAAGAGSALELVSLTVKARELADGERRSAVLTLALDTSGSMFLEERLELVKRSLATLLQALAPDDRVGVVAYGAQAYLVLPHTPARERERLLDALAALTPRGASNVEAGLELAYRLADEVFQPHALNRVVLCSDGVATAGARGPEEILKKVKVFAARGIYISTVGFGAKKYDDRMLERLANEGNGRYDFVSSLQEAERIFQEALPSTLEVLAEDAKIQVDFDPEVVRHYRLLGYENRDIADEKFRDDTVDAAEVGPGSSVTALYEVSRRPSAHGALGRIFVRYRDTRSRRVEELELPIAPGTIAQRREEMSERLRFRAALAEAAELLRESYWARDGSWAQLLELLRSLSPSFQARPDVRALEELALRAQALTLQRLERP
jgi:Ca-activated chloride channel family protein